MVVIGSESITEELLGELFDAIAYPRDGPSRRELSKHGFKPILTQRQGLGKMEVLVRQTEDGSVRDIRVLDYWLFGFFRMDHHLPNFSSHAEAQAYFNQYGVPQDRFESILKPKIPIVERRKVERYSL